METKLPYLTGQLFIAGASYQVARKYPKAKGTFELVSPGHGHPPYVWDAEEAQRVFPVCEHHSHLYKIVNLPHRPLKFVLYQLGTCEQLRTDARAPQNVNVNPVEEVAIDQLPEDYQKVVIDAIREKTEKMKEAMANVR